MQADTNPEVEVLSRQIEMAQQAHVVEDLPVASSLLAETVSRLRAGSPLIDQIADELLALSIAWVPLNRHQQLNALRVGCALKQELPEPILSRRAGVEAAVSMWSGSAEF